VIEAAEVTEIPVAGAAAHYGAMAYFAVLAYPGITARDHAKRDQLIAAVIDWLYVYHRNNSGMRRVTRDRTVKLPGDWQIYRPTMKNEKVLATLNRAQGIIFKRRLPCAELASALVIIRGGHDQRLRRSALQITVGGEQTFTRRLAALGNEIGADSRTMLRYWRETLPVLHLAYAFGQHAPPPAPDDRQDLIMRCVRDHRLWLNKAVAAAESRVYLEFMLPSCTSFDPAGRIALVPSAE
jgi:hypothetical protein